MISAIKPFSTIPVQVNTGSFVISSKSKENMNDTFFTSKFKDYPYNIISEKDHKKIIELVDKVLLDKLPVFQTTQLLINSLGQRARLLPEKLIVCSNYLRKKDKLAEALHLNQEASKALINRMNTDGKRSNLGKLQVDNIDCWNGIEDYRNQIMQKYYPDSLSY